MRKYCILFQLNQLPGDGRDGGTNHNVNLTDETLLIVHSEEMDTHNSLFDLYSEGTKCLRLLLGTNYIITN